MSNATHPTILLVEDDPEMREVILIPGLTRAGFHVDGVGSARDAYRALMTHRYDAVILDVMLPDDCGFAIAAHVRRVLDAGIVMLSGTHTQSSDRIRALDGGADAYVTKPVDMDMLTATLRSVLRRMGDRTNPAIATSPTHAWRLLTDGWDLACPAGTRVRLTQPERVLLGMLFATPGESVPREDIILGLGGDAHDFDPHRLVMLVHRLRSRVQQRCSQPLPLSTVRGHGYAFVPNLVGDGEADQA